MKPQVEILREVTVLVIASFTLCQCATQEVKRELTQKVERKGETYSRELTAQSPFKKVEMSWREASELMKERNPKYRQAILDKEESLNKKGIVNNLTHEVRKSLTSSLQTTLNPSEIAKAMKDPVASLPRQLESITDLKNISHSLTQSEWGRVTQSVRADAAQRQEMVNLHVLFCQSENLEQAERELKMMKDSDKLKANKVVDAELVKAQKLLEKERSQWLDRVRDFFNAEYYDVELNAYQKRLSFYRDVTDPGFSDWRRWRMLENSDRLASEMQKQHDKDKPVLPGMNRLKENLGVSELRSQLAETSGVNQEMAKEVRQMLKNWRNLKSVQQKIVAQNKAEVLDEVRVNDLKRVTTLYQLKKKELDHLKVFWMIDEECWKSEKSL